MKSLPAGQDLYIIVREGDRFVYNRCGIGFGGLIFILRGLYTVRGPLERFKFVEKWTKIKIDIYAVSVIIF